MGSLLDHCVPAYKKNPDTSTEDLGHLTKRDSVKQKRQIKSTQGPIESYDSNRHESAEYESDPNR